MITSARLHSFHLKYQGDSAIGDEGSRGQTVKDMGIKNGSTFALV